MIKKVPALLFTLLLFSLFSQLLAAEQVSMYVTDEQQINMRSGIGPSFKIVKILKSGAHLKVIETSKGYTHVTAPGGKKGWVLSRFLTDQPIARERLQAAEEALKKVQDENQKLKTFLKKLVSEKQSLSQSTETLNSSNSGLQDRLHELGNTCSRAQELSSENDNLRKTLLGNDNNMALCQQENLTLKENHDQDWALVGAGLLFSGLLIGWIAPNIRFRKKNTWNSL